VLAPVLIIIPWKTFNKYCKSVLNMYITKFLFITGLVVSLFIISLIILLFIIGLIMFLSVTSLVMFANIK
jgi:hypothetical protein